jgi:2-oxoglutarate/2-oxoacid ferredoxin oxidoreductase subunit beta
LSNLIVEAVMHEGFSVIDVLQPSVVFSNTFKEYNERTEIITKTPSSFEEAIRLAKEKEKRIPIGVFYKVSKPVYHKELMGSWNPIRDKINRNERLRKIKEITARS